jgi:hypothetical protein
VRLNGPPAYGGTRDGARFASSYTITLNGARLRQVRLTDPAAPAVPAPPDGRDARRRAQRAGRERRSRDCET